MKRKLRKFIKKHRASGVYKFKILTTSNEIIIVADRYTFDSDGDYESDQIRFKY